MAKSICNLCPHRIECAEWGIENEYYGIWGGLTERQRQSIRRQRNISLKGEGVA
jgi:WhiB family transcriptional regulator, redox-sensing transcriptional regulator